MLMHVILHRCALDIQLCFRRYRLRQRIAHRVQQRHTLLQLTVIRLQSLIRAKWARREYQNMKERWRYAVIRIQAIARGKKAKQELKQVRNQH